MLELDWGPDSDGMSETDIDQIRQSLFEFSLEEGDLRNSRYTVAFLGREIHQVLQYFGTPVNYQMKQDGKEIDIGKGVAWRCRLDGRFAKWEDIDGINIFTSPTGTSMTLNFLQLEQDKEYPVVYAMAFYSLFSDDMYISLQDSHGEVSYIYPNQMNGKEETFILGLLRTAGGFVALQIARELMDNPSFTSPFVAEQSGEM